MQRTDEEVIEEKYPESYFEHYVEMFQSAITIDGFKEHANTYIHIEGLDEFKNLINEIKIIDKNNDWDLFAASSIFYDEESLNVSAIKDLAAAAIELYKKIK